MRAVVLVSVILTGVAGMAQAQAIENACLRSDRAAKSRALCGCIQQAANLTLSAKDQKLASTFYSDPQKAQDVRQSGRWAHERFWERYKEYAEIAQTFCG